MKALKKFEFPDRSSRAVYDWDNLLDGKIYQATKGEDFDCEIATFTMMLRDRSKKRGKGVKIALDKDNPDVVTFQAIELTEEQQAQRKALSDRLKAGKAAKKAQREAEAASQEEVNGEEQQQEEEQTQEEEEVETPPPAPPRRGK